ncbi:MAG TPA: hypothetical protein VET51_12760 [Burkholderiales bacterium]|nr:hypothetical protein [Burkholderiales bacterium]
MLGKAAVAMWWDIAPEMKTEFEDWHSHEHMPERLGIPGFLRGTRWIAFSGEPSYFILYEAVRLATITGGAYLERLNSPTAWSRKMMPHHRNMVRSLCRVRASFGGGIANALATIRFSPAPGRGRSVSKWLATDALPALPERKGLTGAHLLESRSVTGPAPTTEQKIRGKDAAADAILLIGGYDVEAVKAVVANELRADIFASQGALPARIEGFYRPAFSLTSRDKP